MRKEFIILAVVIVAAAAYLFTRNNDKTHYELPQVEAVEANDITKIEIKSPGQELVLNKKAGVWTVGDDAYAADEENAPVGTVTEKPAREKRNLPAVRSRTEGEAEDVAAGIDRRLSFKSTERASEPEAGEKRVGEIAAAAGKKKRAPQRKDKDRLAAAPAGRQPAKAPALLQ